MDMLLVKTVGLKLGTERGNCGSRMSLRNEITLHHVQCGRLVERIFSTDETIEIDCGCGLAIIANRDNFEVALENINLFRNDIAIDDSVTIGLWTQEKEAMARILLSEQ